MVARLLTLGGLLWAAVAYSQPSVYVFLPRSTKPAALERLLRGAMPGLEVTVFGRVNDLKAAIESAPPTAVIAPRDLLLTMARRPELQGEMGGDEREAWILVSTGPLKELSGKTFGVIDILGRKKLSDFVGALVGVAAPKVESVSKPEDLMPLLQFGAADVLLVPESALAELRSRSQMDLQVLKLDTARVGRAAVAFVAPHDRSVVEGALRALPGDVFSKLGVDRWAGSPH